MSKFHPTRPRSDSAPTPPSRRVAAASGTAAPTTPRLAAPTTPRLAAPTTSRFAAPTTPRFAAPTTPRLAAPPLTSRPIAVPPAPSLLPSDARPHGSANIHSRSFTATSTFAQPTGRQPQPQSRPTATVPPQTVTSMPALPRPGSLSQAPVQAHGVTQARAHVQTQAAHTKHIPADQYKESTFRQHLSPRFQNSPPVTLVLSLIEFLMLHRPEDLENFSDQCCQLYTASFSRKNKNASSLTPRQPQLTQPPNAQNPTIPNPNFSINGQAIGDSTVEPPPAAIKTVVPVVASTPNTAIHHESIPITTGSAHHTQVRGQDHAPHQYKNPVQPQTSFQPTGTQPPVTGQAATPPAAVPLSDAPPPAVRLAGPSTPAHAQAQQQSTGERAAPPPALDFATIGDRSAAGKERTDIDGQNPDPNVEKVDKEVAIVDDEKKAEWEYDEPEEWRDKVQLLDAKHFVQKRYQMFMQQKKELEAKDEQTPVEGSYVIWRRDKKNSTRGQDLENENFDDEKNEHDVVLAGEDRDSIDGEEVLLPKSLCLAQRGLVGQSKQFPPLFLSAIRFFWTYLVADTVPGGAIFSHGIGFPSQHLLWLFVRLYFTTFAERSPPRKLLIITTSTGVSQWVRVGNCSADAQFKVSALSAANSGQSIISQQSDEIERWQMHGGVLVCSYDQYINLTSSTFDTETNSSNNDIAEGKLRDSIFKNLCRNGPDIAILDEATRLATFDPMTRALFSRMSTRSRLALTSVSIGGNLMSMYAISSWTSPSLLGRSVAEFWVLFMEPIINGNRIEAEGELGQKSYCAARCVWRALRHVMFTVDISERREALRARGKCLSESSVELNFNTRERLFYKRLSDFLFEATERRQISCYLASYLLSISTISIPTLMKLIDCMVDFGNRVHGRYTEMINFLKGLSRTPGIPPAKEDDLNNIKEDMKLADMSDDLGKTSRCLSNLSDIIKQDFEKDGPYDKHGRKFTALKKMVAKFTAMKDRVVVFASCELLREELVKVIDGMRLDLVSSSMPVLASTPSSSSTHSSSSKPQENSNQERKQMVYLYEPKKPEANDQLRTFNLSEDGAVLIAPYGTSVSCSEDDGWSFVNATKVVMLEYSWIVQPVVQALHRVHNFACQGSFHVDVIYLKSVDSIDAHIDTALSRRFRHLFDQTSQFRGQGFKGKFPCHDIAGYRGFMIEPELSPMFLKPPSSIDAIQSIPKVPDIVRGSGRDVSPKRAQFLEQLKDVLLTMESKKKTTMLTGGLATNNGNDIYAKVALSKFEFNVTKYYELCNILEFPFVSDSDILLRDSRDEEEVNPFEKELIRAGPKSPAVAEAIRSRVLLLLQRDPSVKDQQSNLTPFASTCLFSYVDSSLLNNAQTAGADHNGMLDLWRYYFTLYESSERRTRYVLPVTMRTDGDAILGDDSSSRGENMQNDGERPPRRIEGDHVRGPVNPGHVHQDYEHRNGNHWNNDHPNFSNNNFNDRNIQNPLTAPAARDPAGPNPGRESATKYGIEREAQFNTLDDPDSRSGASNWVEALDEKRDEQNNDNEREALSVQDKPFRKRGRDDWGLGVRHEPNFELNGEGDSTPHTNNPNAFKRRRSSEEYDGRRGSEEQWHTRRNSSNWERGRHANSRDSDDHNGPRRFTNNRRRYWDS